MPVTTSKITNTLNAFTGYGISIGDVIFLAVLLIAVDFTSHYNYLLFHTSAELISILIAFTVSIIAFNCWKSIQNQYLLFIGIAYFFVGFLDVLHTISFKGIPIFKDYDYYAPQFWIASRYMESISTIIGYFFLGAHKRINVKLTIGTYIFVTTAIVASILYFKNFPVCFVAGEGLTAFKINSEYLICAFMLANLGILHWKRDFFEPGTYRLLQAAAIGMILMELCFTLFVSDNMSDIFNEIGHLFKIITFYLIYKAIVVTALRDPVNLLFRELKTSENNLQKAQRLAKLGRWNWTLESNSWEWSDEIFLLFNLPKSSQPSLALMLGKLSPAEQKRLLNAFDQCRQDGTPFSLLLEITQNTHEIRYAEIQGEGLYDNNGKLIALTGFVQDVTERQRLQNTELKLELFQSQQERLKESEKSLILLRNASDGIHILDYDGNVIEASDTFCNMLGYTRNEVIGMNVSQWDTQFKGDELKKIVHQQFENHMRTQFETRHRRKDGSIFDVEVSGFALELNGQKVLFNSSRDITSRRASEEKIKHLAFYDSLTNLPNRRLLVDRLQQVLASSSRSDKRGALLFIDLDNFKNLNDTRGHETGDLLLKQVAERLNDCTREGDTVARFGGDEFVVMLKDLSDHPIEAATQAGNIANKILASLNNTYKLGTYPYHSTASIGITIFNDHEYSVEDLLKQADLAMYQSKNAGRNTMRFFDQKMQENINNRTDIERELRLALQQQQLQLYYQIQVDSDGHAIGAEALIRWIHPERGFVSPLDFIPVAEETGLILPIGKWVLETACAQIKAWEQNKLTRNLVLSINISARQFRQSDFVTHVLAALRSFDLNPSKLKLELTESILLENVEGTIAFINALNQEGVQFSLDDFGTGYSSLQYLKKLPLDELKIDQSFVRDITFDEQDRSIVRTIIAMAHSLELEVVAEGVETEEQRQILINNGCKYFQGYLFGKPLPIVEFEALIR